MYPPWHTGSLTVEGLGISLSPATTMYSPHQKFPCRSGCTDTFRLELEVVPCGYLYAKTCRQSHPRTQQQSSSLVFCVPLYAAIPHCWQWLCSYLQGFATIQNISAVSSNFHQNGFRPLNDGKRANSKITSRGRQQFKGSKVEQHSSFYRYSETHIIRYYSIH